MTDTLPRFRVTIFIRGSVCRPCYGPGHIDVYAPDEETAIYRAKLELKRGAWPDVSMDAFRVDGVERIE